MTGWLVRLDATTWVDLERVEAVQSVNDRESLVWLAGREGPRHVWAPAVTVVTALEMAAQGAGVSYPVDHPDPEDGDDPPPF